jgi:hypothetical protein
MRQANIRLHFEVLNYCQGSMPPSITFDVLVSTWGSYSQETPGGDLRCRLCRGSVRSNWPWRNVGKRMGDSRIADRRLFGWGHLEQTCAVARFLMGTGGEGLTGTWQPHP